MCINYEPKVWGLYSVRPCLRVCFVCVCVLGLCVYECVIALSYASPGLLGYLDVEYRYHYYAKSD